MILDKLLSHQIVKDLSWVTITQTLGNVLRFLMVFIVIRCYSQEEFGLWATITSVAAVIVTGDFGLTNVLRNIASEGLAKGEFGDKRTKEAYFSSVTFLFLFALMGIIILLLFRDVPLFESLFKTDNAILKEQGKNVILAVLCIFLLSLPLGLTGGLFLSYGEVKESSVIGIINSVLTFCIVIGLSIAHVRIDVVSVLYFLCSLFMGFVATFYFLKKRGWSVEYLGVKKIYGYMCEMLPSGIAFLGIGFSSSFIPNVLTIYASSMLGLSAAANINVAQKIYTFFMSVLQSIYGPIWARLSMWFFTEEYVKCKQMLYKSLIATVGISIFIVLATSLLKDVLVYLIAGSGYEANMLIFILVGGCLFSKVIFDNASLLLIATSKLKLVASGYCLFCGVVFFLFPMIINVWGFNWMMVALICCWVIFIMVVLTYTFKFLIQR